MATIQTAKMLEEAQKETRWKNIVNLHKKVGAVAHKHINFGGIIKCFSLKTSSVNDRSHDELLKFDNSWCCFCNDHLVLRVPDIRHLGTGSRAYRHRFFAQLGVF